MSDVTSAELLSLLQEPSDTQNALISIQAEMGGDEAHYWVEMLLDMISSYAKEKGLLLDRINLDKGASVGVEAALVRLRGQFAYGLLQSENGMHRLIRRSPVDDYARRHMSAASVRVYPVLPDQHEIKSSIDAELKQVRTYTLDPTKLVKDHRTGFESKQVKKILSGDLDSLVLSYLKWSRSFKE